MFDIKLFMLKNVEYFSKVLFMFICGLKVNENVLKNNYHGLVGKKFSNTVHKIHKSHQRVSQTKQHHQKLKMVISCVKFHMIMMLPLQ